METTPKACGPGQVAGPAGCACPPGAASARRTDGSLICSTPPELTCAEPFARACDPAAPHVCRCAATLQQPASAMACQVSIVYTQERPQDPQLLPMGAWCDAAGMELAVAVILARLLGAPGP